PGARRPKPGIGGCQAVGEGAGDGGGPAGDLQQAVDVFQVGAHGCLGDAQAAGDLGVGVPGGDQVQQVPVPRGEPGGGVAAALGVEVGLVQVRAQHGEQVAVAFAEVPAGPAEQDQPQGPPGPGGLAGTGGQAQHQHVLDPVRPASVVVEARAVPLPGRVEIRDLDDA